MGKCLEGIVPRRARPRRVGHQRFHTTRAKVIRTQTLEDQPLSAVVFSLHHFAVEMYSGDTTKPRKRGGAQSLIGRVQSFGHDWLVPTAIQIMLCLVYN